MAVHRALFTLSGASILAFATVALAIAAPAPAEVAHTKLACSFETGHVWTYEAGKFSSSAPSPLKFEIDDIDLDGQSAKLVLDGKEAGKLRIVRALNANHFLEVANEGFLNLTTIYDAEPGNPGVQPAVHSRHFGLLGQPMFAQYPGTCNSK